MCAVYFLGAVVFVKQFVYGSLEDEYNTEDEGVGWRWTHTISTTRFSPTTQERRRRRRRKRKWLWWWWC